MPPCSGIGRAVGRMSHVPNCVHVPTALAWAWLSVSTGTWCLGKVAHPPHPPSTAQGAAGRRVDKAAGTAQSAREHTLSEEAKRPRWPFSLP